MNFNTSGTALIIGGSSGMGLATAKKLLAENVAVLLVGRNNEKLQSAKAELMSLGNVSTLQADLYQQDDVARLVEFIDLPDTNITYLVNAAGYFSPKAFIEHSEDDYESEDERHGEYM